MEIREMRPGDESRWDDFVMQCDHAIPQHLIGWKDVMTKVFNSDAYYLLAEDGNCILGVLPLIHIKSLFAGHYVTSVPGGLCATNQDAARLLLERAKNFVKTKNANYLILRDGRKKWDLPELMTDEEHITFIIETSPDLDVIKHAMKRNTRQLVNQSSGNSMKAAPGYHHLVEFYPIYSRAMHEFGNPTLGLNFFKSIADHFPENIDLITLFYSDQIVGGGFVAPFNQTVYCLWSGLLQKYYDKRVGYSLIWESIKYAHCNGFQYIDLGRCRKNSGSYKFKKRFGGQVQQLYQQTFLNGVDQPPNVGAELEDDLKFQYFIKIWRKLPQFLTEILGPEIRKQVPFG